MAYMKLGDLLMASGLIDGSQLKEVLDVQKKTKQRLGTVLIERGCISEQDLIDAMSKQTGIEFIDLSKEHIPAEMARLLPEGIAKKHGAVPVKIFKDTLVVAMADPTNFVAADEIRAAAHRRISLRFARAEAVEKAVSELYGSESAKKAIEEMRDIRSGAKPSAGFDTSSDLGTAPTVRLVNSIIERAVLEKASDIHIEPRESETVVRMRIDGILHRIFTVPKELTASVISRIKVMADLDLTERRVPQDGRTDVTVKGTRIDLRISTIPTVYGEKMTLRILDRSAQILKPDALGLYGDNLEKFRLLMGCSGGMVLIVGPTGSGKSSTMYTAVDGLNTEEVNIITLEDPVEYSIAGVNQIQINEKIGMTFANGLRSALRQDPDIIAVGEIRDPETAETALRAAITGHLVLSTVHTNSAVSMLDRLLDMGCEPYLIAEAVRGVISQRLVRKICPDCREEYEADADDLKRMGLSEDAHGIKVYRGRGCPKCYHTGYRGRTAVFEIILFSKSAKRLIAKNVPRAELMDAIVKEGNYRPLRDNVYELVRDGVTTVGEMFRILNFSD